MQIKLLCVPRGKLQSWALTPSYWQGRANMPLLLAHKGLHSSEKQQRDIASNHLQHVLLVFPRVKISKRFREMLVENMQSFNSEG
ncbi:hypothetical protein L6452_05099 [Arctium lappa]|uniref:Uncharacterized protein n=1 Tax=Arctium lappa TaxID=4217 RepID=A0ACB9EG52_ARCLA|nr:hypothetical protein L6452_05099 [Arctium lappa]